MRKVWIVSARGICSVHNHNIARLDLLLCETRGEAIGQSSRALIDTNPNCNISINEVLAVEVSKEPLLAAAAELGEDSDVRPAS